MNKAEKQKVYLRAAELIEDNFTTGTFARDHSLVPVGEFSENAVCFCTVGALKRALWELNNKEWSEASDIKESILVKEINTKIGHPDYQFYSPIFTWNDNYVTGKKPARMLRELAEETSD